MYKPTWIFFSPLNSMKPTPLHWRSNLLFPRVTYTIPLHGHTIINVSILLLVCKYSSYFHVLTITITKYASLFTSLNTYAFLWDTLFRAYSHGSCRLEGLGEF